MAGIQNSRDPILERKRRITISIPGYDAAKEVKKVADRFKRHRESEKRKSEHVAHQAKAVLAAQDAKDAEQLTELNSWLVKPTAESPKASANTQEGNAQCIFL